MTTFAESLKKEIARVARKELKSEMASLRKTTAAHRGEIAALKRELKSLASENRALARRLKKSSSTLSPGATSAEASQKKPGRKVVYSAEKFAAMRSKLGLTQAEMGRILGASSLSVYKWESGQVEPREKHKNKILELRSLGKHEAKKALAQLSNA